MPMSMSMQRRYWKNRCLKSEFTLDRLVDVDRKLLVWFDTIIPLEPEDVDMPVLLVVQLREILKEIDRLKKEGV